MSPSFRLSKIFSEIKELALKLIQRLLNNIHAEQIRQIIEICHIYLANSVPFFIFLLMAPSHLQDYTIDIK